MDTADIGIHCIQSFCLICSMVATIHPSSSLLKSPQGMNDTMKYLIIDTGGGKLATITKWAWYITATMESPRFTSRIEQPLYCSKQTMPP